MRHDSRPGPVLTCPNCGASGDGKYCSACGRRRVTTTASLGELLSDAWDEALGIERRLLNTLWQLFRRPGFLTDEYRKGRGGRYTSPVRILIVSGAIYLAGRALEGEQQRLLFGDLAVGYTTVQFAALPLFAFALFVAYHREGRPYSEYLTFALYFQSAVLLCTALASPLPDNAERLVLSLFTLNYLAQGSRRLWGQRGLSGWLRAGLSFFLYLLTLFLVFVSIALLFGAPAP